jgi:hypothetical protein
MADSQLMKSLRIALVVLALVVAGCSGGSNSARRQPTGQSNAGSAVKLVAAPDELRTQCAAAAAVLRFAVPCPTQVPMLPHRGAVCETGRTGNALPACVGLSGAPQYLIFFLEFTGFDQGWIGPDGNPSGHLIVEAQRRSDAPTPPCIGDPLRMVAVSQWNATEYRCSSDSNRVQRAARHGEGAHLSHLLLAWTQDGIDYDASIHGYTDANFNVLRRLVASLVLVPSHA